MIAFAPFTVHGVLITEMDGSMLPVVEVAERVAGAASVDGRKTRQVSWKEARLALAHEPGSVTPIFGATPLPHARANPFSVSLAPASPLHVPP
jgi:hypothetical protein